MTATRTIFSIMFVAAGIALLLQPQTAPARQKEKDDLPKRASNYSDVAGYKNALSITAAELPKAKAAFEAFAAYNAQYISHPKVYSAPQEFKPDTPNTLKVYTLDELLTELNRHILVPEPSNPVKPDQADYIRELGIALDTALGELARNHPEPIVRVNAMRMLAVACRSGAVVHYATITGFITNANTRPEVRYYAFQAAGNLLAAYDLNIYETRGHSNKPAAVAELIVALQNAITNSVTLVPGPPAEPGKPPVIDADRARAIGYIRRQAVRALAQVRFAEYKVQGGPTLYPGYTLARVAVSDPAVVGNQIHPLEVAEAVIGLCNMAPPRGAATEQYTYAITDAVATGIITFAGPRAADPTDRTVPWRGTASRINDALKAWKPVFDPGYNPLKPNSYLADTVPKLVNDLILEADRRVLGPIEKADPGIKIDVEGLRTFRRELRANKKWSLVPFRDDPKLVLPQRD